MGALKTNGNHTRVHVTYSESHLHRREKIVITIYLGAIRDSDERLAFQHLLTAVKQFKDAVPPARS
jgi:hypothetical protein